MFTAMLIIFSFLGVLVGFLSSEWILWSALEKPFFEGVGGFQYLQAGLADDVKQLKWWERLPLVSLRRFWMRQKMDRSALWFSSSLTLLNGMLFGLNAWWIGGVEEFWFWQLLTVLLLMAAFYDLAYQLIPELLLWAIVGFVMLYSIMFGVPLEPQISILGAGVVGGLVMLIYVLTKGKGIGGADIYMSAVVGMLFGWSEGLLVFSLGNIIGLLVILPLFLIKGKKKVKQVPLVFFLVIAVYFEFFFLVTNQVFSWLAI